jgi:hypothetical protein
MQQDEDRAKDNEMMIEQMTKGGSLENPFAKKRNN